MVGPHSEEVLNMNWVKEIQQVYRETVLATSRYVKAGIDSPIENIAPKFDTELVVAVDISDELSS